MGCSRSEHNSYTIKPFKKPCLFCPDRQRQSIVKGIVAGINVWGTNYNYNYETTLQIEERIDINISENHEILALDKIILVNNNAANLLNPDDYNNAASGSYSGSIEIKEILFRGEPDATNLDDAYEDPWIVHKSVFNGNYYNNMLDQNDIDASGFNESDVLSIVDFNHENTLSNGSINSLNNTGKLTLRSIDVLGRNGQQYLPSYNFSYYNENYMYSTNENNQDDWGYYIANPETWSLKEIETPLGSIIKINYESDELVKTGVNTFTYLLKEKYNFSLSGTNRISVSGSNDVLTDFQIGDQIKLEYYLEEGDRVWIDSWGDYDCQPVQTTYNETVTISYLENTFLEFTPDLSTVIDLYEIGDCEYARISGSNCDFSLFSIRDVNIKQGGLRVNNLIVSDMDIEYTTEYNYSDGITSYLPSSVNSEFIPYVNEIPGPEVMYEYVSVENKNLNNESELVTHYKFEVLPRAQNTNEVDFNFGNLFNVEELQTDGTSQEMGTHFIGPYSETEPLKRNMDMFARSAVIHNSLANLGRLLEVNVYNSANNKISKTIYDYYLKEDLNAGILQESTCDIKRYTQWNEHHTESWEDWYFTTSSRKTYPNVLKSTTTYANGNWSKTSYGNETFINNGFDFNSGMALIIETENSAGEHNRTEIIPAYTILQYQGDETNEIVGMGSKLDYISNKNMLTQQAAAYTYLLDASDNISGVLSASIQTWEDEWSYRGLKTDGSAYEDKPSTGFDPIWRLHQNYIWKGDLDTDGTYLWTGSNGIYNEDFDWTSGANNVGLGWQKTSEVTRYNHYSSAIEVMDINDKYASSKYDLNNEYVIASIANAEYNEFAYSGTEEGVDANGFLADNVKLGICAVSQVHAHTGVSSVKSTYAEPCFFTKIDYKSGKRYRASVWVLDTDGDNAEGTEIQVSGIGIIPKEETKQKFGDWVLITQDFIGAAGNQIAELQCVRPGASETWFDDFRVHPIDAPMSSYVYDKQTGQIIAILNNHNIATFYEYDEAGRLTKTSVETPDGFILASENNYGFARAIGNSGINVNGSSYIIENENIIFTTGNKSAASYNWDFGDGNTSTDSNPVHSYAEPGTYTVILNIFNGKTTLSFAETIEVAVTPVVSLSASSNSYTILAQTGGTASIQIVSNTDWEITDISNWLEVIPSGGNGDTDIIINTTSANRTLSRRVKMFTLKDLHGKITLPETFIVAQNGLPVTTLKGSVMHGHQDNMPVSGIKVIASGYWAQNYYTYTNTNGNYTLIIPRDFEETDITVHHSTLEYIPTQEIIHINAGDYQDFTLIENLNFTGRLIEPRLMVDNFNLKMNQNGSPLSGSETVNVSISNQTIQWNASVSHSWINISAGSGTGDGSFQISCDSNFDDSERSGQITITTGVSNTVTINVRQAPICFGTNFFYNFSTSNCEKL